MSRQIIGAAGAYPPGMVGRQFAIGADYGVDSSRGFQPQVRQVVNQRTPNFRKGPLGFAQDNIAANSQATIQSNPQVIIRGGRLVIPSSVAQNFRIIDLTIAQQSQFNAATGTAGVDATLFSQVASGMGLLLNTSQPGVLIVLTVLNKDPLNAHDFRAAIFGDIAR